MPVTKNNHALTDVQHKQYKNLSEAQQRKVDKLIAVYDRRTGGMSNNRDAIRDRNVYVSRVISEQKGRKVSTQGNSVTNKNARLTPYTTTVTKQSQGQRSNSSTQPVPRNNTPAAISDTTAVRTQAPAATPVRQTPVRAQAPAPAAPAKISNKVGNTPARSNKPTTHTIAQGETLSGIAKKYGVDWRQLAKDNGIEDPNMIIAGRKLNINGSTKTPKRNKPRRSMRTTPADTRTLINASIPPVTPSLNVGVSYPGVREGIRTPEEILGGF